MTLRISLPQGCISARCQQQLDALGFSLECGIAAPWLTLVDLSGCQAAEVSARLKGLRSRNLVALLNPEQTELASAAMGCGAQDYLLLPLDEVQLVNLVQRLHRLEQADQHLVAASPISKQLLMLAHRAAITDASVLLTGESGTGKEPLARYIHRHSGRSDKPFIAVNCAAIPEHILESVLFGHVKGAFTGATHDQPGKFELANGGTLLLDEIGELPLMLQAKLLRVLQEREIERVGSHKTINLDIRIIAATNRDLRQAVSLGQFREDLFYRLDVLPLNIRPLRERKEDILPLAEHFIQRYQHLTQGQSCYFSDAARQLLLSHSWPGNVRELENCIQRSLVLRRGQALQAAELGIQGAPSLPAATPSDPPGEGLKASKKHAEFQYVIDTLKRFAGHRARSAESLGMTTRALRYKLAQMRDAGIDIDQLLEQAQAA
ncbi:sigma-54 interaction domain-containing protein [Shewanella sp. GXUN23E]|uniref:sigma-54 interaction domain-containing protein n=1 Tax=Shewanella sp. GXUN23E TaxID=3422498 RepID=UPI003D7E82AD